MARSIFRNIEAFYLIAVMPENMTEISSDNIERIRSRVLDLYRLEEEGNVDLLAGFTLPSIVEQRCADRNDEPELTRNSIEKFVGWVGSAVVSRVEIVQWHESAPMYDGAPAAKVEVDVHYNGCAEPSKFSSIWVLYANEWYTTALGKFVATNSKA